MINEKQLSDTMKMFEKNKEAHIKFMWVEIQDMADTLEMLWKIARAAKKWTQAYQGKDSVEAEQEMVKALEALKECD